MFVNEVRAALPDLPDRVAVGEEITITRHGTAVALDVRPDAVRVRRADRALADAEPLRDGADTEVEAVLLARLDLRPLDEAVAGLATALGAEHGLRAADAVHLGTAVSAGADHFITNNSSDFAKTITEIDVICPMDLPIPEPPTRR